MLRTKAKGHNCFARRASKSVPIDAIDATPTGEELAAAWDTFPFFYATVGRNALTTGDLDAQHLKRVNAAITQGRAKHVFISAGVARLMGGVKQFAWLRRSPAANAAPDALRTLFSDGQRTVHAHLHFSNYGKFEALMQLEVTSIRELLGGSSDFRPVVE